MAGIPSLRTVALTLARLALGGIFLYAALNKIIDPLGFVTDILHYRLIGYPVAVVVDFYLPWVELVCGVGVIFRWRERAALSIISSLCVVFTIALFSAWLRGIDLSCGCFGHQAPASPLVALTRTIALGLLAALLAWNSLGKTPPRENDAW